MNSVVIITALGLAVLISTASCIPDSRPATRPPGNNDLQFGKFRDCHERWTAGERIPGVYTVYPNSSHPVKIYCRHSVDYTYAVIQRRYYGNVNFNRNWQQYQVGFGDLQGDHWLGLDTISLLTATGPVNLQVDLQDWSGTKRTVYLHGIRVDPASNYYRLTYSTYSGPLADDFSSSKGMYFYTPDRVDQGNCAVHQKCGWWFNPAMQCALALPNGLYYTGGRYKPTQYYDGIYYRDWLGFDYSLKYVTLSLYK